MSLNLDIDSLPPEQVAAAITRLEAVKAQRAAENKLAHYRPYPKQAAFHEAGAKHRERLLMCANRFGKTMCGAAELAFHLTGDYPEWWNGKRFDKPVRAWAAGVTAETTRDVLQEKLIGPPFRESEWGTGMIPKAAIAGIATSRGIPSARAPMKWKDHPNLRNRPPTPSKGRGPVQVRIRRAFVARGAEVLSSTQIYDWTHSRRRQSRRKKLPFGVYWRTLKTLRAMCDPIERVPPHGAWLWRLRKTAD